MRVTLRRVLYGALLVMLLMVVSFGAGLVSLNLSFLKGSLSNAVQQENGLALFIEGPLRLRLGPKPTISAAQVSLARDSAPLLSVDSVRIRPGLWNSLKGEIDIRLFEFDGLAIQLCTAENCGVPLPEAGWSGSGAAPLDGSMRISLHQQLPTGEASLAAEVGRLSDLLQEPERFPLAIELSLPDAEFELDGEWLQPFGETPGFILSGSLQVAEWVTFLAGFGIDTPFAKEVSNPWSARMKLTGHAGEIHIDDMQGVMGESAFALSGAANWSQPRPWFELRGELDRLMLTGLLQAVAEEEQKESQDLSFQPLLDELGGFDGLLVVNVGEIFVPGGRIEKLHLEGGLEKGLLEVEQVRMRVDGQTITAQASLDSGGECPTFNAELQLSDVDMAWLERMIAETLPIQGSVEQALVTWHSCGTTISDHLESMVLEPTLEQATLYGDKQVLPVYIDRTNGQAGWRENGQLTLSGRISDESFTATVQFGPLGELRDAQSWRLAASAAGSEARLQLEGQLTVEQPQEPWVEKVDMAIEFQAAQLGQLSHLLAVPAESDLPAFVQAQLAWSSERIRLDLNEARLGGSDLSGRLEWADPGSKQPVLARLSSSSILIDELEGLAPPIGEGNTADPGALRDSDEASSVLPPVDLDIRLKRVMGDTFEAEDVAFSGTLQNRGLRDAQLRLTIADRAIEGSFDLDLAQRPASLTFDFGLEEPDIGGLIAAFGLVNGIEASARSAQIRLETRGDSSRALLENAHADVRLNEFTWSIGADSSENRRKLLLEQATFDLRPIASSELRGRGVLDGMPLAVWLQLPPMNLLLERAKPLPFQAALATDSDITLLEGKLDRRDPNRLLADLAVTGEFLSEASLPDFSEMVSPRADVRLETSINLEEGRVLLDPVSLQVASSRVNGSVDLRMQGQRLAVDATLKSPYIETEDFVLLVSEWCNLPDGDAPEDSEPEPADEKGSVLAVLERELAPFKAIDFNFQAEVTELRSEGELLGHGSLNAASRDGQFQFELSTDGPEGEVLVHYQSVSTPEGLEMNLDARAVQLEFGGLMRLFNPESTASGELFLDASLSSRAGSGQLAVDGLMGHLDVLAFPREVGAAWLDLWASNLLFALLSVGDDSNKKMNCMVASFQVENGLMTSNNTFLDTTDVIVRARGEIDLAQDNIDLWVAPQAKVERFLSVQTPLKVTGSLQDFEVNPVTGGFVATMIRWYYGLIYVPWKWLTGQRFPADGTATCLEAVVMELPDGSD